MEHQFNFKELYDVVLKPITAIQVGDKRIEPYETFTYFDKIQVGNFQEIAKTASATGGKGNATHIVWRSSKEMKVSLTQGVFSERQMLAMSNANILNVSDNAEALVWQREEDLMPAKTSMTLENDTEPTFGNFYKLLYQPVHNECFFVYDAVGNKVEYKYTEEPDKIYVEQGGALTFDYFYTAPLEQIISIGEEWFKGYFMLSAKTTIKDDTTGRTKTGIINIPKLKIMSSLQIQAGKDAYPMVQTVDLTAYPVSINGITTIMEFVSLQQDVTKPVRIV